MNLQEATKRINDLERENTKLRKLCEGLEKRLRIYENPHTPPSRRIFKAAKKTGKPKKRGAPIGHKGTTRKSPKPIRTLLVNLDKCPDCHNELGTPTGMESRIIEEIPKPQPLTTTEFILEHYHCKFCNKDVVAFHPECPEKGGFGKNVIAHSTLMKFDDRLPYRKVRKALKRDFDMTVSPASILNFAEIVSRALEPHYKEIIRKIRNAKVLYIDESTMKVDGKNYWIWIFTAGNEEFVVIRESRGKHVLEEILGPHFNGIIVCDGWRSYKMFSNRLQRCWAHILREAEYIALSIEEGIPLYKELKRLYERNERLLEPDPPPDEREFIQANSLRILKRLIRKDYKSEKVRKFITKIENGIDHWFTYVTKSFVEPTNNRAERALREHIVQRKIFGTLRNEKGIKNHERIMSVLATWNNYGINVFDGIVSCL